MLKGIARYERAHTPWAAFLDDEMRAETDPRWLSSKRWDGVISRHTTPLLVKICRERKIPLVDLNDIPPYKAVPKIRPDNAAMGRLGAEHLIERGFTSLGYCGFGNDLWSCERRDAFIQTARTVGHKVAVLDVDYPGSLTPFWDDEQVAELSRWLKGLSKPIGIMACNDMRALQLISAAHMSNLLVPEEVAILGANNESTRCDLAYPSLSSIAANSFQAGYLAAETLARLIAGTPVETMDLRIEPLGVTTRQSTDLLAIQDRSMASALAYIREHACEGLTVEQVIQKASASRSLLEKKFRQLLGRSPHAEIRRVQVAKIKQLLIETDYPLKRIAELTGFEHVEYLCVLFKRSTHQSPGEYRRNHKTHA
jgi:LacI family transcriptional regulator